MTIQATRRLVVLVRKPCAIWVPTTALMGPFTQARLRIKEHFAGLITNLATQIRLGRKARFDLFSTPSSLSEDWFPKKRHLPPQHAFEGPPFPPAAATFFILQAIFLHYACVPYLSFPNLSTNPAAVQLPFSLQAPVFFTSSPYTSQQNLVEQLGFPSAPSRRRA
ncbi:hypothetical protein CSUB01_06993 [Colletotrichum sublineola]|uniref:Uncharacterized protein n=1 Tax=Colletotrichum sublineola TaxID=1173701 RepID=A0A066X3B1_COLSU|nr:hypothetical protein CSUB01_06993 [Colletotrichum sublineola]